MGEEQNRERRHNRSQNEAEEKEFENFTNSNTFNSNEKEEQEDDPLFDYSGSSACTNLVAIGFGRIQAISALGLCNGRFEEALQYLLDQTAAEDHLRQTSAPQPLAPQAQIYTPLPDGAQTLPRYVSPAAPPVPPRPCEKDSLYTEVVAQNESRYPHPVVPDESHVAPSPLQKDIRYMPIPSQEDIVLERQQIQDRLSTLEALERHHLFAASERDQRDRERDERARVLVRKQEEQSSRTGAVVDEELLISHAASEMESGAVSVRVEELVSVEMVQAVFDRVDISAEEQISEPATQAWSEHVLERGEEVAMEDLDKEDVPVAETADSSAAETAVARAPVASPAILFVSPAATPSTASPSIDEDLTVAMAQSTASMYHSMMNESKLLEVETDVPEAEEEQQLEGSKAASSVGSVMVMLPLSDDNESVAASSISNGWDVVSNAGQ